VLAHSKAILDKSKEMATTQEELREGQAEMREKMEADMARVMELYESLGNGMGKLKDASFIKHHR